MSAALAVTRALRFSRAHMRMVGNGPAMLSSVVRTSTVGHLHRHHPAGASCAACCLCVSRSMSTQAEPIAAPPADGQEKVYPEHLQRLVGEISSLSVLEVCELNELLKRRLNIADQPMMMAAAPANPSQDSSQEEEAPVAEVQTSFTVKLVSFDDSKKIPLIKELKHCVEGMNLVQAKKFVESVPVVVRADLQKDEASKLQELLTAAGGVCEVI